jgi:peptidoglycan hydrolase-like protein with peptidoglycan-binding domain
MNLLDAEPDRDEEEEEEEDDKKEKEKKEKEKERKEAAREKARAKARADAQAKASKAAAEARARRTKSLLARQDRDDRDERDDRDDPEAPAATDRRKPTRKRETDPGVDEAARRTTSRTRRDEPDDAPDDPEASYDPEASDPIPDRVDSDDLDADLRQLTVDPLYFRDRDPDYVDHVTRQFERIHGPDGPAPGPDGKRRGTLEVPRLRRRPGDHRLKRPVGRGGANELDDVARLQRALSETGDYAFAAPRERSGVMSANLEAAVRRFQRRTGLKPDGYVAPDGPTIQRVNGEATDTTATPPLPARKPGSDVRPAGPDERRTIGAPRWQRVDPTYEGTEADQLIADIDNTQRRIELLDQRIEAIGTEIEDERATLRNTLTEAAEEAAGAANEAIDELKRSKSRGARFLGLGLDAVSTATGLADLSADIGTMRTVPKRIETRQRDLQHLHQRRNALQRALDRLRARQGRQYPRHVPAWD